MQLFGIPCFFNSQTSDVLQHVALLLEIGAIVLVIVDYQKREQDLRRKGRGTMLTHIPMPHPKRRKELIAALAIGLIAVVMEAYQLATQYWGC